MREDMSFSNRKLTNEEFSEKYWLDGEAPYQYHIGSIEDGRDEREQFVFNNIRALKEAITFYNKYNSKRFERTSDTLKKMQKKITGISMITAIILVLNLIMFLFITLNL